MRLGDIFESEITTDKKPVVVMGGRFQPFHRGHYHVYLWLCKKFGKGNVWIATSNKTNLRSEDGDISPFNFQEKQEIITSLYGIDSRKIIECRNPAFKPTEVFNLYRGFNLVYIAAVGQKDKERYSSSSFFEPLTNDIHLPGDVDELMSINEKKGYYVVVPMKYDGISGTEVREALINADDKEIKKLFEKYFGKYDDVICDLIVTRLKEVK